MVTYAIVNAEGLRDGTGKRPVPRFPLGLIEYQEYQGKEMEDKLLLVFTTLQRCAECGNVARETVWVAGGKYYACLEHPPLEVLHLHVWEGHYDALLHLASWNSSGRLVGWAPDCHYEYDFVIPVKREKEAREAFVSKYSDPRIGGREWQAARKGVGLLEAASRGVGTLGKP